MIREMPSHWMQPEPFPELEDWESVIDFILPVKREYFASLPRENVFIGLFRTYELRTRHLVESVRPNWYRLTPFGRFIQDRILGVEPQCGTSD